MPFSNQYNKNVASKVIANAKRDIATKEKMYDNPAAFVEPHSQQEYATVEHPEVRGGSGNLAASSYDMGYEPKKVGGAKINIPRAKRVAKALEGGAKPMVVTDTPEPLVKAKRGRKAKTVAVAGGDFGDIMDGIKKTASTVGDVVKTAATVAPYVLPLVGLGKEGKSKKSVAHLSEWNAFVKKTREETGKSLKDTLKYIKEHNLYKRKGETTKTTTTKKTRKTKEGGSSGGILINEVVNERTAGDVVSVPRATGGVPSMRVPKARAKRIVTK